MSDERPQAGSPQASHIARGTIIGAMDRRHDGVLLHFAQEKQLGVLLRGGGGVPVLQG